MAQYTEREWTQTKDTEQLTFIAGANLPYRELVKETGPNTNIVIVATTADAIGYVLSPKGVLSGEKVDIQMLSSGAGASPPSPVLTANSVIGDGTLGNEIQLENEEAAPAADHYYGTDAGGTRGFHPFPAISSNIPISKVAFVNPDGDDGTGVLGRFDLQFQTIDAAIAAGGVDNWVYVYPGIYEITPYVLDGTKPFNFYFTQGAILQSQDGEIPFLVDINQSLNIRGHCQFQMRSLIWQNNSPGSGLVFVSIEAESLEIIEGAGSPEILDFSSWVGWIKVNSVTSAQYIGQGYMNGTVSVNQYMGGDTDMFIMGSPNANSPGSYYGTQGFPKLTFCGRDRPYTKVYLSDSGNNTRIFSNSTTAGNKLHITEMYLDTYFGGDATMCTTSEGILNMFGYYRGQGSSPLINCQTNTGQAILNVNAKIRSSGEQLIADIRQNGRYTFKGDFYADQSTGNPAVYVRSFAGIGTIQIQFGSNLFTSTSSPLDLDYTTGHNPLTLQFQDCFIYNFGTNDSINILSDPVDIRVKGTLTTRTVLDPNVINITSGGLIVTDSNFITTAEDF